MQVIKKFAELSLIGMISSFAQSTQLGWQPEQILVRTSIPTLLATNPKISCAYSVNSKETVCVYTDAIAGSQRMNLVEISSNNGGANWTAPKFITNLNGDEYDPYMEYDSLRERFQLVYSKWRGEIGGNGNDLVISYRLNGQWQNNSKTGQYDLVAGQGKDYWVGSSLLLRNGTQLVFANRGGPEDKDPNEKGYIYAMRSTDAGRSWSTPTPVSSKCGAEYVRAVENRNGHIMAIFSRHSDDGFIKKTYGNVYNYPCKDGMNGDYIKSSLHTVWSEDDGRNWIPASEHEAFIAPTGNTFLHPYIQKEVENRQIHDGQWTLTYTTINAGRWVVRKISSIDQGLTWGQQAEFPSTDTSGPFNIDPIFINTCRGFLMTTNSTDYNSGAIFIRRYDWNDVSACSKSY